MPSQPGEIREPLRGIELAQAVGFGLLSLTMGTLHFQIPGMTGSSGDLREVALIVAAFHLRRWWLVLVVGAITSLATPPDGSLLSTLAIHAVVGPVAWFAARSLQRHLNSTVLLGIAWVAFVPCVYYAALAVPIVVLTNPSIFTDPWVRLLTLYGPALRSLNFEISATALLTGLYLVNIRLLNGRRAAEASLRASEERLAGILAAAPVGMALVRNGRICWANERLTLMADRSLAELAGMPREALLAPYIGSFLATADAGTGGPLSEQFTLSRGNGETLVTLVQAAAMPGEGPATYTLSILDVTSRVQLEQQLHQAQKMEALGQVTASIAHDFNNLLQVVHLTSQRLEAALERGEAPQRFVARINQAVDQGRRVIGQLLAFSRNQRTQAHPVDLGELVERSAPLLRTMVGRDLQLSTAVAPGLPHIHADPGQVEQVLLNLVINARDAIQAHPGGTRAITVTAQAHPTQPDQVLLAVADTGAGMDEATRARIFEPFFTTKTAGKGTGLGLATVFGIVQHHGGSITLTSAPGQGTTFSITWPCQAQDSAASLAATGRFTS